MLVVCSPPCRDAVKIVNCLQRPQEKHGDHSVFHELVLVHVVLVAHQPKDSLNTVGLQYVSVH